MRLLSVGLVLLGLVVDLTTSLVALAAPFAYIGNYDDQTISIVDSATDTVTATLSVPGRPLQVVVSPDATRVYVCTCLYNQPPGFNGCYVSVFDTVTNTSLARVPVGQEAGGIALSPDARFLYATQHGTVAESLLFVIDTAANAVTKTIGVRVGSYGPEKLVAAPDGTRLYIRFSCASAHCVGSGPSVAVFDLATSTLSDAGFGANDFVLSLDGSRIYAVTGASATAPGTLWVIDATTLTTIATMAVGPSPRSMAITADGTRAYVANGGDATVSVLDLVALTPLAAVPVGVGPSSLALTPDERRLYVVTDGWTPIYPSPDGPNTLAVVDTAANTVTTTQQIGRRPTLGRQAFGPRVFVARGDLNGDWHPDLLWQHQTSGDLYLWGMMGATLTTAAYLAQGLDPAWHVVGTADLTGDGRPDLLWRHATTGDVALWAMVGSVRVGEAVLARGVDPAWQLVATADYNNDGQLDLFWQHATTGQVYVWYLNGLTVAAAAYVRVEGDPAWRLAAAVDLDKNGSVDFVWQHKATGGVYVWYFSGSLTSRGAPIIDRSAWFSEGWLTEGPQAVWTLASVVDLNADGRPDLVWHHPGTGDVYVWFMNGTTATAGAYIAQGVDRNWNLVGPR